MLHYSDNDIAELCQQLISGERTWKYEVDIIETGRDTHGVG